MNNPIIEETRKQVRRYWTEDGLPDLYIGLGFLLYGLLSWWAARDDAAWLPFAQAFFLPAWIGLSILLLRRFKEHFTYPRTGYVTYARPPRGETTRRVFIAAFFAVLLALLVLWAALGNSTPAREKLFALFLPLVFAAVLVFVARQQSSWRYGFYALAAALSGVAAAMRLDALSRTGRTAVLSGVPVLLSLGAVMLLGGLWTMFRYLRRHPRPEGTA